MKKTIYIAFGLLLATVAGCKKNSINQLSDTAKGAQIKFVHVAPGVPALNGLVNNTKISLTQSVSVTDAGIPISIATGYTYLGVFPSANYSAVASGNSNITVQTATPVPLLKSPQTVAPATTVGNITQATVDGGAYSVFTYGLPGSTTTPLTTRVVEDKFPANDKTKAFVRFANMVPNGGAYDLTGTYTPTGGTATTKTITTGTAYSNLTDFVAVDVNTVSTTGYIFQMKTAGTTVNFGTALGTTTTPTQLTPGRYYTIIGRGLAVDYTVPGTSILLKASARPTVPASTLPEIYFNAPGLTLYTNK